MTETPPKLWLSLPNFDFTLLSSSALYSIVQRVDPTFVDCDRVYYVWDNVDLILHLSLQCVVIRRMQDHFALVCVRAEDAAAYEEFRRWTRDAPRTARVPEAYWHAVELSMAERSLCVLPRVWGPRP